MLCLQETDLRPIDICNLKVIGWKKVFHANGNQKKAGVAILISDKMDCKTVTKDKDNVIHNDQGLNPRR